MFKNIEEAIAKFCKKTHSGREHQLVKEGKTVCSLTYSCVNDKSTTKFVRCPYCGDQILKIEEGYYKLCTDKNSTDNKKSYL